MRILSGNPQTSKTELGEWAESQQSTKFGRRENRDTLGAQQTQNRRVSALAITKLRPPAFIRRSRVGG